MNTEGNMDTTNKDEQYKNEKQYKNKRSIYIGYNYSAMKH